MTTHLTTGWPGLLGDQTNRRLFVLSVISAVMLPPALIVASMMGVPGALRWWRLM